MVLGSPRSASRALVLDHRASASGIIARLVAGDACADDPCDVRTAVGFMTIGGTVIGAASGLLVGAALPAGQEWGSTQSVRVLRVGSVTLRPEVRLSLRAHASSDPPAR